MYPEARFNVHSRSKSRVGVNIRKLGIRHANVKIFGTFAAPETAYALEAQLRPRTCMGWNLASGGLGGRSHEVSHEARQRISVSMTGAGNHRFGKLLTEAQLSSLRARSGERNHRFGVENDPEHRAKISESLQAKVSEWRRVNAAKAARGNKGKIKSESQRANMALAAENRPRLTCPYCGKEGQVQGMKRYHMDNCKKHNVPVPKA